MIFGGLFCSWAFFRGGLLHFSGMLWGRGVESTNFNNSRLDQEFKIKRKPNIYFMQVFHRLKFYLNEEPIMYKMYVNEIE